MSEHECIIGEYYDYGNTCLVTANELKILTEEWHGFYSFKDYCDRRKSTNLERFEFCPYCGKKIDWKKIKKEDNTK